MKLVVIDDAGEQTEARCDGCKHWKTVLENPSRAECYRLDDMWTKPEFFCALFEAKEPA